MKFARILVLHLSLMAASSALAAPLPHSNRCPPGSADVRCTAHNDDHGRVSGSRMDGRNVLPIHERQLSQTLKSILAGLPIVGPILAPLIGTLLGVIGLSEMDVASASNSSLNAEQITALANFEFALSNAVHKCLSDGTPDSSGAQSKLKTREAVPLAELTTGVPVIGPFMRPLVSLLEALDLDTVDAKPNSVFSLALLSEDQSTKLAQFQTILRQEFANVFPDVPNSTLPDPSSPSKASPDNTKPSQPPSSNASDGDGSDGDTLSPDNALPADLPTSTPISSLSPTQVEDPEESGRS